MSIRSFSILRELSIWKTIVVNLRLCNWDVARRFPIFVAKNVLLNSIRGQAEFKCGIHSGIVRIGFNRVPVFDKRYSRTVLNISKEGRLIFNGSCFIGSGSKIGVGGELTFGDKFILTAESAIVCDKTIKFGNENIVSWHCQIMDTDFHDIIDLDSNAVINHPCEVTIGNRVWIGSRVTVLKGAIVPDDTIIAASSLVSGRFIEAFTILAGVPASVIKRNVARKS